MSAEFVVLRTSHVDALFEEWGDLDQDPFWQPVTDVRVVPESVRGEAEALASACTNEQLLLTLDIFRTELDRRRYGSPEATP